MTPMLLVVLLIASVALIACYLIDCSSYTVNSVTRTVTALTDCVLIPLTILSMNKLNVLNSQLALVALSGLHLFKPINS